MNDYELMVVQHDLARTQIGHNLRRIMRSKGVTQSQLATRMGCKHGNICYMIQGRRMPNAFNVKRLALALGVSTDELLRGVCE